MTTSIKYYTNEQQQTVFNQMKEVVKQLTSHKDFEIKFDSSNRIHLMYGFIEVVNIPSKRFGVCAIPLTMTNEKGQIEYTHLMPNIANYFNDIFNIPNFDDIKTSINEYKDTLPDICDMKNECKPVKQGKRKVVDFFPFIYLYLMLIYQCMTSLMTSMMNSSMNHV